MTNQELVEQASKALSGPGRAIADCMGDIPAVPGLYSVHASPSTWSVLTLEHPGDSRPLYVGKSESSLVERDLELHFGSGDTGRSTLRRSLAALLVDEFRLEPVWRNPRRPSKPTHYALTAEGDDRLTDWMHRHLRLAVWSSPAGCSLATVEKAVFGAWQPPLNLIGVETPWRRQVKAARAAMAARLRTTPSP